MTSADPPEVSVIAPVYRDWERARGLLQALRVQDWRGFEVILVDNDPNASAVPRDLPDPGVPWRVVPCAHKGSYAARNAGAAAARGGLLVFTDADCRPVPGWLAALRERWHDNACLLAGPVLLDPGRAPGDWAIFDTVRGMDQRAFIRHGYAVTANLAVPRAVHERLGGFDPARLSGGDAAFCRRAGRAGIALALVAEAAVVHPARATRAEQLRKARRIKGGQLAAGPLARRVAWTLRSLVPPLREMAIYLASAHPLRWRLIACRLRIVLWGVELAELVRLLVLRHPPERR